MRAKVLFAQAEKHFLDAKEMVPKDETMAGLRAEIDQQLGRVRRRRLISPGPND